MSNRRSPVYFCRKQRIFEFFRTLFIVANEEGKWKVALRKNKIAKKVCFPDQVLKLKSIQFPSGNGSFT
jgi:hypothetical protein